jgi:arylsulfatase A-like enzyme
MREDGYLTAAFVRNPFLEPPANLTQGFDAYHVAGSATYASLRSLGGTLAGAARLVREAGDLAGVVFRDTERSWTPFIARLGGDWIERHADQDFFLWIHFLDPHTPYAPPDAWLEGRSPAPDLGRVLHSAGPIRTGHFVPDAAQRDWIRTLYAGEVGHVDNAVGSLLDRLRELGLYQDALVVLTSDHGEEFWEHGGFEHGHSLYDEVVRVPLLIKLPRSSSRTRVDEFVSIERVPSTLLELCGLPFAGFLGAPSLSRTWMPSAEGRVLPVVSTGLLYVEDRTAVVLDGHKYIRTRLTGREELYDLVRDPGETRNLAEERPKLLARLRLALRDHLLESQNLRLELGLAGERHEIDPDWLERLRSLGYVE